MMTIHADRKDVYTSNACLNENKNDSISKREEKSPFEPLILVQRPAFI